MRGGGATDDIFVIHVVKRSKARCLREASCHRKRPVRSVRYTLILTGFGKDLKIQIKIVYGTEQTINKINSKMSETEIT